MRRMVRWKNELSFMTKIPAAIGQVGHLKVSLSADLVDLDVPPTGKNLLRGVGQAGLPVRGGGCGRMK